ncbi:MAG: RNA 2',3'-cyclic phosphodiesterase [Gemmatimonadaceae bacterium]
MRLFVALNLTDELRAAVAADIGPVRERARSLRWVRVDQIHVTLKFLGELQSPAAQEVGRVLDTVASATPDADLVVRGRGAFPNFRRPRVVWIGVQSPTLVHLAARLGLALVPLGIAAETRAFRPHLTVGRVSAELAPDELAGLREWSDTEPAAELGRQRIATIDLMRSELGPGGSRYSVLHRAALAGSTPLLTR